MGRISVHNQPVAAIQLLLDVAKRTGLLQLEAILACTFTFDDGYFGQILDALAECHPDGSDHLRSIPIDVVCDYRHYRVHDAAHNVHCWEGNNLFHPKLILLLFTDRVVWVEGSLNLTRAGYTVNRELATYHENMRRKLPWGVRELVRQLAGQRVDAAKRVLDAAGVALRTDVRNRSVTSLDTALLVGLFNRAKQARSVYIVSPFFDRREHTGPSIESTVLRVLAKQYPKAQFRIFLPEITRADGKLALQGSKALFALVFGPKTGGDRLAFCGVPSDQRPLHAKLLAIRHGKGGTRATVLTGSPNLTENALRRKGTSANVELARELVVRWKDVEQLLLPLGRKFKKLSECLFEPPQSIAAIGWHVLKSASYHPLRRELELEWRRPDAARQTKLYYAEALLNVPVRGPLQGFGIRNGELRLETVCRADPSRRSWWPIVIPFGEQLALAELPEQETPPPEWWLAQLGALPVTRSAGDRTRYRGSGPASAIPATFSLGQRVRDLAERMGYVGEVLANNDSAEPQQVDAHLDLLEKIFEVHDPETATDPTEQVWRMWVRLEITQAVALTASVRGGGGRRRHRLMRQLSMSKVPDELILQWRALTDSMT